MGVDHVAQVTFLMIPPFFPDKIIMFSFLRKNIGYASTCNSVGQTAGYFLGYVVFVALESADFCNKYLRSEASSSSVGLLTLPGL